MIHVVSTVRQEFRSYVEIELDKITKDLNLETPRFIMIIQQQLLDIRREVNKQPVLVKKAIRWAGEQSSNVEKRNQVKKFPTERTIIMVNVKEEYEEICRMFANRSSE